MNLLLRAFSHFQDFLKKKRKIRFAIISVFMGLLSLSLIVTTTYTYVNIQKVMDLTSRDIINKTQRIIVDDVVDYLKSVLEIVQVGVWIVKDDLGDILDDPHLLRFMMSVLQTLDQVGLMYASDAQGNYISLGRLGGKKVFTYQNDRPLPHDSTYYIDRIDRRTGQPVETRDYISKDWRTLVGETNPGHEKFFDPRVRPWFRQTLKLKRINWSPIYTDFDTGELSMTVSQPIFNPAGKLLKMMSVDIRLNQISALLRRQKVSLSGINFIINGKGEVVGYPDPQKIIEEENGVKRLITMDRIGDPILEKIYQYYKITKKNQFFISYDNIDYIVYFLPFPKAFDKDWMLGMVAPADDFVGALKATSRAVLGISLLILGISSILLVIFSHRISYPIELLAKHMRSIKNLEIDEEIEEPNSGLEEITQMDHELHLMQEGLTSFGKFVPKALVRRLIETGHAAGLGGERKKLGIMFSDIANFTHISESMDSDALMTHLSEYFSLLSQLIIHYQGTIDKYIGDAIMAFWGAPEDDPHLLLNACTALLICQKHLIHQNQEWKNAGKPFLITRFGLHYGEVIVGNVGSADRLNYTVIGDGVNLASRLEGLNKIYGTFIAVSDTVYNEVKDKFLMRPLDVVAVKGKTQGVTIYELMAKLSQDPELQATKTQIKVAELTEKAFAVYQKREWGLALAAYEKVWKEKQSDPVSSLYIDRCQNFIASPPPETWDGIYRLTTK